MNGVWHTLLKLILNSRRTEQEHVLLNDLGSLVKRLASSIDGGRSLVINGGPGTILGLGNIARCDAERTKTFGCVILTRTYTAQPHHSHSQSRRSAYLKMLQRSFRVGLILAETF